MGCPYEGLVPIEKVVDVSVKLIQLGCYEISLGDTIGVGTPGIIPSHPSHPQGYVSELIQAVKEKIPIDKIAVHFHDTYGQALGNILAALQVCHLLHRC